MAQNIIAKQASSTAPASAVAPSRAKVAATAGVASKTSTGAAVAHPVVAVTTVLGSLVVHPVVGARVFHSPVGKAVRHDVPGAPLYGMPEPLISRKSSSKPCCDDCGKAEALGKPKPCRPADAEHGASRLLQTAAPRYAELVRGPLAAQVISPNDRSSPIVGAGGPMTGVTPLIGNAFFVPGNEFQSRLGLVSISVTGTDGMVHGCSGVMLSPHWLITTFHCLQSDGSRACGGNTGFYYQAGMSHLITLANDSQYAEDYRLFTPGELIVALRVPRPFDTGYVQEFRPISRLDPRDLPSYVGFATVWGRGYEHDRIGEHMWRGGWIPLLAPTLGEVRIPSNYANRGEYIYGDRPRSDNPYDAFVAHGDSGGPWMVDEPYFEDVPNPKIAALTQAHVNCDASGSPLFSLDPCAGEPLPSGVGPCLSIAVALAPFKRQLDMLRTEDTTVQFGQPSPPDTLPWPPPGPRLPGPRPFRR